ncbi:MAG: xylulokinase [Sulfobacillus thermotolerans]|nr:xylulokinase [Sulfobacillus thermotolerans]
MDAYIGLDVGTQGMKGVVVDEAGSVLDTAYAPYPTQSPAPGWQEQNPQDWLMAYDEVLQRLMARHLPVVYRGIGFTGQMHTTVACGANGVPVRPAILWSDTRAAGYGEALEQRYGLDSLVRQTANKPLANFSVLRLLWMKDHEPEHYRTIQRVAVAKDWVRDQVTGTFMADVTDGSGTYLFDVGRRQWNWEWMHTLSIPRQWWADAVESPTVVGDLRRGPQALQHVPVVAGAGDQEASAVGTGLTNEGDLGVSIGTSGVIFWPRSGFSLPPHPSIHAFCHAVPGMWHWMAVTQSAALSLRWYRDTFAPTLSYHDLDQLAASSAAGSHGLLFFPYLQGERAPLMNAHAQGTLMGLRPEHRASDIVRAILEGVVFSLFHAWLMMKPAQKKSLERMVATGGGAQSTLWMQILADVFQIPVTVVDDPGAAVGAAWLARRAISGDVKELSLRVRKVVEPSQNQGVYAERFHAYRSMAMNLNGLWGKETVQG